MALRLAGVVREGLAGVGQLARKRVETGLRPRDELKISPDWFCDADADLGLFQAAFRHSRDRAGEVTRGRECLIFEASEIALLSGTP